MKPLGRISIILAAFISACFAASLAALAAYPPNGSGAIEQYLAAPVTLFGIGIFLFGLIVAVTALPAFVFVLVAEFRQVRSLSFYLMSGALFGAALQVSWRFLYTSSVSLDYLGMAYSVLLWVLVGAAGGFVYWVIAGRRAGVGPAGIAEQQ